MTLAAPIEPTIDSQVLGAWLRQARAGDVFEYHRGLLMVDRGPLAGKASQDALDELADGVYRLAAEGRVHLVQRRVAPGAFSYLAVARSPVFDQHLEARR